jgi:hypothetical protein
MRQLYIACITTIADYGIPIWWNFQKQYIDQFAKLQNYTLRKMLGVFKITPDSIMEIRGRDSIDINQIEKTLQKLYGKNFATGFIPSNTKKNQIFTSTFHYH